MKKVLLDTSVIIDFLRKPAKEHTLFFSLTEQKYHLAISIITHTEIFSGKSVWENKKLRSAVEDICAGLSILSLDKTVSIDAGHIRAMYGTTMPESIIAANAIASDLQLVTLNTKDFEKIKDLSLWR